MRTLGAVRHADGKVELRELTFDLKAVQDTLKQHHRQHTVKVKPMIVSKLTEQVKQLNALLEKQERLDELINGLKKDGWRIVKHGWRIVKHKKPKPA